MLLFFSIQSFLILCFTEALHVLTAQRQHLFELIAVCLLISTCKIAKLQLVKIQNCVAVYKHCRTSSRKTGLIIPLLFSRALFHMMNCSRLDFDARLVKFCVCQRAADINFV